MIENKLLYLNLSVDSSDTSLGFVETWISNFLNDFDKIDVLTLNKSIEAESISEKLKIVGSLIGRGRISRTDIYEWMLNINSLGQKITIAKLANCLAREVSFFSSFS